MDERFFEKHELDGGEIFKSLRHIKETPKLPINSLFVAVQLIGKNKEVEFGKGKKKYYINFGGYTPKTAREKALFISLYYALIYYAVKGKDKILLTDLMENIGYHKRPGHGYIHPQKEEALEMIWNVAKSEVGISGNEVPKKIKELFPEIEKNDKFTINLFSIRVIKQFSADLRLKNAVIFFEPNFDKNQIYFNRNSEVLKLGLHEPEYKNLAIYISYGRMLKKAEQITKNVKELLEIIGLDAEDRKHANRTYDRLVNLLERARRDGYIQRWWWERYPKEKDDGKPWVDLWLNTDVTLILPD